MKILKCEIKSCISCMKTHGVKIVEISEKTEFKGEEIEFQARYEYCKDTDEYVEIEDMIRTNDLAVKDAYRKKIGLLTSYEIIKIREKYKLSQKDFSDILNWSKATITRYENHQVQDGAHDDILRKIDSDPSWLLYMLKRSKNRLSEKAYDKYYITVSQQYNIMKNQYLIDAILAIYAKFKDKDLTGGMELRLDKVVALINYLASKVNSLHKVKLMKLLWYSDILNYKRYGRSITGLVYFALQMGAFPEGCDQILKLEGISFDTVCYNDNIGYKFKATPGMDINMLSKTEFETVDKVISELGDLNTDEIIEKMHEESEYKETPVNCIISYSFASRLSIE